MSLGAVFLLSFAVALAGAVCIWVGRCGRRVGDHLHCRHCERDLFGMPWDASRCPECGNYIKHGKPRGRLERRMRLIYTGLGLLAVSLPAMTSIIYTQSRKVYWIEKAPLWYVLQGISGTARGQVHLAELRSRIRQRKLTPPEIQRVIAHMLAHQADPKRPWISMIGELIEDLHFRATLSSAQWSKYLEQGAAVSGYVRPVTPTGDPIAAALYVRRGRLGMWTGEFVLRVEEVTIDGTRVAIDRALVGGPIDLQETGRLSFATDVELPPGDHEMVVSYSLQIGQTVAGGVPGNPAPATLASTSATQYQTLRLPLKVSDQHVSVTPVPAVMAHGSAAPWREPTLRRLPNGDVEVALQVGMVPPRVAMRVGRRTGMQMGSRVGEMNEVLAYDVILRDETNDYPAGAFCIWTTGGRYQGIVSGIPADVESLEVIFEPSPARAMREAEVSHFRNIRHQVRIPIR